MRVRGFTVVGGERSDFLFVFFMIASSWASSVGVCWFRRGIFFFR